MRTPILYAFVALLPLLLISCSKDYSPDQFVEQPAGEMIEHVENVKGHVWRENDKWCLCYIVPYSTDGYIFYYPAVMPKIFCKFGLEVVFSGDVYENDLHSKICSATCRTIILTKIKKTEK